MPPLPILKRTALRFFCAHTKMEARSPLAHLHSSLSMLNGYWLTGFAGGGGAAVFLTAALAGGTGVTLAALVSTGLAAGVVAAFCVAVVVAVLCVAVGVAVVAEAPLVVCAPVVLTADIDVPVEVPPVIEVPLASEDPFTAGAHGTPPAVVVAPAGAAGAAAFFLPNSDPKFEIAAAAFETAVLAPAAVCPPAEFAAPATAVPVGLHGARPCGSKAVACPGAAEDTPLVSPR
jgi:hypothetical protein